MSLRRTSRICPADADGNNVYDVTVQVADGHGSTDTAAVTEDAQLTATGNVLANDTDPNGDPVAVSQVHSIFTGNFDADLADGATLQGLYGTLSIAADGAYTYTLNNDAAAVQALEAGQSLQDIFAYQATDRDGSVQSSLTVTINGADAIEATTGALSFINAPNFEAPTDAGANNIYDITVTASDGTLSANQAIAVSVTDASDTEHPPAITSDGGGATAAVSVAENSTAVTTVTATDPDAEATLTYSISGGADAAMFTINATTGALSFINAPNFEAPTDAGANNVYDVVVQVSDGLGGADAQAIAVEVIDVDEVAPHLIGISPADPAISNAALVHYTVTFSEAVTGVDAAQFTVVPSSVSGASIVGVSPVAGSSGTQWTIAVETGSGSGSLALHFNGNAITDVAGNKLVDNPQTVLSPANEIAVGGSHGGITTADVDNDGAQDVIVVTSDQTAVLLGNGDGTFAAPVFYSSGLNSSFVAAGDLDGDQNADLVVTNYGFGVNTVSMLRGNGDGTFQGPVTYAAGQTPWVIRLADVDANGTLDAIVSNNSYSNGFSVLKGNGDGSFQSPVNYAGAANPVGLAVTDFNGDQVSDIAVISSLDTSLRIYLGGPGALSRPPLRFQHPPLPSCCRPPTLTGMLDRILPGLTIPAQFPSRSAMATALSRPLRTMFRHPQEPILPWPTWTETATSTS